MPIDPSSAQGNAVASPLPVAVFSGKESLSAEVCFDLYRHMARARALEERMIKMSKSGEGYFWIGGPGEEAFNAALGMQVKKGRGPDFDYLHLHYRNSATMVAMGMSLLDGVRQMAMTLTDPHSLGRNFPGHYARSEWNVMPISSVIENQFVMAPGTAWVQRRHGGDGITIVVGGDAGTAEGDFASCLVWSSRPGLELPVLMIVMNNGWGISTAACGQHGEKHIIDRGEAFGIPGELVDGNDPVASWYAVMRGMEYVRTKRAPFMIEAQVSRLYGHSSSSGALRVKDEPDCIALFEQKLIDGRLIDADTIKQIHADAEAEVNEASDLVANEARPSATDVPRFTYAPSRVDAVYPDDYTGLPQAHQE
jgi:2-oxoisovalerate dehydrogenase E1 component alpha subunit